MKIYVVGIETSFDYRKFPWIKKSRGAVSLKANLQTVVAENAEDAERKYREAHSKMKVWPALNLLAVEGLWKVMCRNPNEKSQLYIRELDKNAPLGEYLQYMAPADIGLLTQAAAEDG